MGQFRLGAAPGEVYNNGMGNIRYFSGARDKGRIGVAGEIMRIEILKKGKLPAAERYKSILKKKFEENKQKTLKDKLNAPIISGFKSAFKMSKHAEQALKQIAQRKARKEAKAMRKMVIVESRRFPNGNITAKGKIYDVAGNLVAEVNRKNGNISTTLGWGLGKYRPKSYLTNVTIQNAIDQYSPYFINQRKQQLMQQQGVVQYGVHGAPGEDVINVYGPASNTMQSFAGTDAGGPRQNIGMTSWGARSDNVWGTYTDNVWGKSLDNVWGSNSTDVWGGISVGGMWGGKGMHVWGTGNGKNYLRGISNFVAGLFGFTNKQNRNKLKALNARASSSGGNAATMRTSAKTAR